MARRPTIGARGRRFTLQLPMDTPDGFGGVVRSYGDGPLLWGAIEAVAATERPRAGRLDDIVTHRVTLPFRDDLTPAARLSCGPRTFRIKALTDPDGRKRRLVCSVEEMAP